MLGADIAQADMPETSPMSESVLTDCTWQPVPIAHATVIANPTLIGSVPRKCRTVVLYTIVLSITQGSKCFSVSGSGRCPTIGEEAVVAVQKLEI